jgi:hypothetical protein
LWVTTYLSKIIDFNCFINGTDDLQSLDYSTFEDSLIFLVLSPIVLVLILSILFMLLSLAKGGWKKVKD